MRRTSALVVGAGSAGRRHMRNLRRVCPDASVTCWRATPAPPDTELQGLAQTIVFDEASARASRPDIVIVAGPATTHARAAIPFVSQGIPVLVEKPIAASLEDCDRLLEAVDCAGGVLLVGYQLRFNPLLQRLSRELESGVLGRLLGIRAEVGQYLPDWRPGTDWRKGVTARADLGGGALLEISHEFDYVRWLFGEVRAVGAATGTAGLGLEVEDYAEVVLKFVSGAIGSVHLDLLQRPMVRRCRAIGERGVFELDLLAQTLRRGDEHGQWHDVLDCGGFERNTMFLDELRHFLDCATGRSKPLVSGEDGRRALSIALGAREAAARGALIDV